MFIPNSIAKTHQREVVSSVESGLPPGPLQSGDKWLRNVQMMSGHPASVETQIPHNSMPEKTHSSPPRRVRGTINLRNPQPPKGNSVC